VTKPKGGWFKAHRWLLGDERLTGLDIVVFYTLSSYTNVEGTFPRHERIAEDARVSVATVKRSLGRLRKIGLVDWDNHYDGRGQTSNRYRLSSDGKRLPVTLRETSTPEADNPAAERGGDAPRDLHPPLRESDTPRSERATTKTDVGTKTDVRTKNPLTGGAGRAAGASFNVQVGDRGDRCTDSVGDGRDSVASGKPAPPIRGEVTGYRPSPPADSLTPTPIDAETVADTTKGTTVATSQQIKTDWLDRARPLGHPDLDEYDRLADQLIADDAVDALSVRVAVKDCTGPTSRHARDRMLTALRDLAAEEVAS
jgi:hypothetical protein